jgi:hypothetical protein
MESSDLLLHTNGLNFEAIQAHKATLAISAASHKAQALDSQQEPTTTNIQDRFQGSHGDRLVNTGDRKSSSFKLSQQRPEGDNQQTSNSTAGRADQRSERKQDQGSSVDDNDGKGSERKRRFKDVRQSGVDENDEYEKKDEAEGKKGGPKPVKKSPRSPENNQNNSAKKVRFEEMVLQSNETTLKSTQAVSVPKYEEDDEKPMNKKEEEGIIDNYKSEKHSHGANNNESMSEGQEVHLGILKKNSFVDDFSYRINRDRQENQNKSKGFI